MYMWIYVKKLLYVSPVKASNCGRAGKNTAVLHSGSGSASHDILYSGCCCQSTGWCLCQWPISGTHCYSSWLPWTRTLVLNTLSLPPPFSLILSCPLSLCLVWYMFFIWQRKVASGLEWTNIEHQHKAQHKEPPWIWDSLTGEHWMMTSLTTQWCCILSWSYLAWP